ncbi:insulinase family protein [Streptomyces sp. NPDC087440]|uniref:insulinase family protein n=1 Tax=Streptomyces sp. NPDC087440 TaxID=3365790 RepID=UPI0038014C1A
MTYDVPLYEGPAHYPTPPTAPPTPDTVATGTPHPYAPDPRTVAPTAPHPYAPDPRTLAPTAPHPYAPDPRTLAPTTPHPYAPDPRTLAPTTPHPYAPDPRTLAPATEHPDGIRLLEFQGIRILLAPRPGPVSAGLFFRVGRADETLATAGLTHLVEHLALHRHGLSDLHYNGATAATYTHFHVDGDLADVASYLNGVCSALRDLPLERLETEREILRTEAAHRGHGANHQMALWRYGARGHGLLSYPEHGLWHLGPDHVRHWAQTRFTRENAVLWITSDTLPPGLDLTLPSGPPHPMPQVHSALPKTPAYFRGDSGVVVMDAVVRRSTAAGLFADVLGRELFRDLRQEGGYSYTATADYSPRDAEFATITALADTLPQKQDAVVGGFVDVLAKLRAGHISQADLDAVRAAKLRQFETPDLAAAMLPAHALSLLTGHRRASVAELTAELHATTLADLHAVAREVSANALLQVPSRGADWAGFTEAPQQSAEIVSGRRFTSYENEEVTLIIHPQAVTLSAPGNAVTVKYAECAAMLVRPDGARRLTGHDGFTVSIEPTLFRVTPADLAVIDAGVSPYAVVPMPARDPEDIPKPGPKQKARRAPRTPRKHSLWTWVFWTLVTLASVWGLIGVVVAASIVADASTDESWARDLGRCLRLFGLVEFGLVTLAVRTRRKLRKE